MASGIRLTPFSKPTAEAGAKGGAQQPVQAKPVRTAHLGVAPGKGRLVGKPPVRLWQGNVARSPLTRPRDLPGGVSVNPRNPNAPGLVRYNPMAGRVVRNPRPALPRDPISNLARAVFLGLPKDLYQAEAPIGRTFRSLSRGQLPSRSDAVQAASFLPVGPKGELALPEAMPGELAGRSELGLRIRNPHPDEPVYNFKGDLSPFTGHWPSSFTNRNPGVYRQATFHGQPIASAHGYYHSGTETGSPLHFDPETNPKSFDFSSIYVQPAFRKTPVGQQLLMDMVGQIKKHSGGEVGPRQITSIIVNDKLKQMVNRYMARQPKTFVSHAAEDEAALQMAQHMWMHQNARQFMASRMARSRGQAPPEQLALGPFGIPRP